MAPLRYKSRNCNRRLRTAAGIIAGKIAAIDGVVGIVATGGLARGHSDEYSDLDLIVYTDEKRRREIERYIAVGQLYYKGVQYDTYVESYREAMKRRVPSSYWSQELRWTLEDAIILHDTRDRIAEMITGKVVFPESERKRLLRDNRHWANEILNYMYPTWQARGAVHNLAHLLRTAVEYIILWIYAYNGRFRPYMRKWPFFYLENGLVPESRYFTAIKRGYTAPIMNLKQARLLRQELFGLCSKLDINIEPIEWRDVLKINSENWKKALDKTREYLSW